MVDGSFRESFYAIDFFGKQALPKDDYELTWVEYYDRVKPELEDLISKYPNFKILTLKRDGEYHSSYCFNAGIMASSGELMVIPDADVIVEENFLDKIWQEHQENNKLVMYLYRYNELEKDHVPKIDLKHLQQVCVLTNPSNYGGCLTVRRKWLEAINGYEQHPLFGTGFHANGRDIYVRFKGLGLHVMWHPELKLYHPWHPSTLAQSSTYESQGIIIKYREIKLLTTAFQGIDPTRNLELPESLLDELETLKRKQERKTAPSVKHQFFLVEVLQFC